MTAPSKNIWLLILVLALVTLGGGGYVAKNYWCIKQLDTPIFKRGDLVGKPDRLIAKLGKPATRLRMTADLLQVNDSLRRFFLPSDVARLGKRKVEILIWEQTCLGSTIWQLAAVVDQESDIILAVGGESSFYSPVYLGGLIIAAHHASSSIMP